MSNPTIVQPATASQAVVTGNSVNLSVLASDPSGNLTYTWSAIGGPVTFSDNVSATASRVTATFHAAGNYAFVVTAHSPSGMAQSSVVVRVIAEPTSLIVLPAQVTMTKGTTQLTQFFYAQLNDQFSKMISRQPQFVWSSPGLGQVAQYGVYMSDGTPEDTTMTATAGTLSATARITVTQPAP